jgi:hypothetical protein
MIGAFTSSLSEGFSGDYRTVPLYALGLRIDQVRKRVNTGEIEKNHYGPHTFLSRFLPSACDASALLNIFAPRNFTRQLQSAICFALSCY